MEWKPTDVTILFVYYWVSTCFGPTGPSSGEFVLLFTQPLVQYLSALDASRADRYWNNGCVNSCTNSPEDGPVGPKHVETQQYTNKIVISVGFHSIRWKVARYKKLKTCLYILGSLHHSTIHKEKSNKMQQCIKILLFHIYMKLNMFRATHRPSSGT